MLAPIRHTCPAIDKQIVELKFQIRELECIDNDIDKELQKDILSNVLYYMNNLFGFFEEMRTANDTLRSWGEEMENKYCELQDELNELENKMTDLLN